MTDPKTDPKPIPTPADVASGALLADEPNDWPTVGAVALVYYDGFGGPRHVRTAPVEKVNARTFRVAGIRALFSRAYNSEQGSGMSRTTYALDARTERARNAARAAQARDRHSLAVSAVERWTKDPSRDATNRAISALLATLADHPEA